MGVFLTSRKIGIPSVLKIFVKRMHALPQVVVMLLVETVKVPTVMPQHRIKLADYGNGLFRLVARYGYAEPKRHVLTALELAEEIGLPAHSPDYITMFSAREQIHIGSRPASGRFWWPALQAYKVLKRMFGGTPNGIRIPADMLMEVGSIVEM